MAQIHISIRPKTVDIFATHDEVSGILTDEHAGSSYGLPVVVIQGTPLGIAEIADDQEIFAHYEYTPSNMPDLYETDEQIKMRRNPVQVALVQSGKEAGYFLAN